MGDQTAIEWADATWNPWWGCTKVSPACTNCYAETLSNRFYNGLWRGQRRRMQNWSLPAKVDRRAAREGRRLRLFVASMADVFDDRPVVDPWRREALDLLAGLRNVDVLLLTKRPENILRMVPAAWLDAWPAHVWVGTTVEDQQRADERVPHLLRIPAPVRFVSYEPALGPVDFTPWLAERVTCQRCHGEGSGGEGPDVWECPRCDAKGYTPIPVEDDDGAPYPGGVDWLIAGGESGPRARPSHPDWFRSVRDQCKAAGVPFLFKQWGEWVEARKDNAFAPAPSGGSMLLDAAGRRKLATETFDPVAGDAVVLQLGKKAAGRLLDGIEHNAFPEVTHG